jgi:hypothetical protein
MASLVKEMDHNTWLAEDTKVLSITEILFHQYEQPPLTSKPLITKEDNGMWHMKSRSRLRTSTQYGGDKLVNGIPNPLDN